MRTELLETTHTLKETWGLLFPKAATPEDYQWTLWLVLHDASTVKEGIAELAKKYHKVNARMDADYMVRFASSVMNRIHDAKKQEVTEVVSCQTTM